MSDKPLVIRDLHRSYGNQEHQLKVLTGVNLQISRGEMVALVAPSGTGKSTLLHSAGLLERPDSGEIEISGIKTSQLKDRQRTDMRRSKVGFVYQFHHLLPEFSAVENIIIPQMLAGKSKRDARDRAMDLLAQMHLQERASHRPSELSGGEQQRVAILRAVANSPALLLADEPTGNLDPETSAHVFGLLIKLVRETGLAALIATHNHTLAKQMDRCMKLENGTMHEF